MFIVALFTGAKGWSKPSVCWQMNEETKMWYIFLINTTEYLLFSLIKEGHFDTGCNIDGLRVSERSQSRKDNYCVIPLLWGFQSRQIPRDTKWKHGYQERGENEKLFNGQLSSFSLIGGESSMGWLYNTALWISWIISNCTLKNV